MLSVLDATRSPEDHPEGRSRSKEPSLLVGARTLTILTNLVILKDLMRSVKVSELKSRLSEYLRKVKSGTAILITDRGHPVAILQPYTSQDSDLESLIAGYPWVLFLAIAILPGLGVPNCPLLILCGTAMTAALGVGEAVTLAVGAVITNIFWTYWVAAFPLRRRRFAL